MGVWRAMALPSRVRVLSHLSHERSAAEATMFLATFKARTDGDAPFFTSDQLPAYVAAWIANDSTPEPPPRTRGPGRPRQAPKRVVDPHLRYAQVDKRRVGGRVVEVKRHILFGAEADIVQVLATDRCGAQINTSYEERDNLEAIRKLFCTAATRSSSILAVMKLRATAGSESIEHQMYMTDLDHSSTGCYTALIVLAVPTVPAMPGVRPLNHPAFFQRREAFRAR